MTQLKIGQSAPAFVLPTVGGATVDLQAVTQSGQHALLVFLRHLG